MQTTQIAKTQKCKSTGQTDVTQTENAKNKRRTTQIAHQYAKHKNMSCLAEGTVGLQEGQVAGGEKKGIVLVPEHLAMHGVTPTRQHSRALQKHKQARNWRLRTVVAPRPTDKHYENKRIERFSLVHVCSARGHASGDGACEHHGSGGERLSGTSTSNNSFRFIASEIC